MSQSALQKPSNQIAEIAVFSKPSWINFAFSYLMMAFVSCITFYGTTIGIKKLHSGWMNLAQKWQNLIGTLWWLKKHNFVPLKFPTWNTTRPDANTIVRVSEIGISSGANLCFAATVADDVRERPDLSGVKLRRATVGGGDGGGILERDAMRNWSGWRRFAHWCNIFSVFFVDD